MLIGKKNIWCSREIWNVVLPVLGSLALLSCLELSNLQAKWTIYILGILILSVIVLVIGNFKKIFLVFFVLSLQIHANFYFGDAWNTETRWVGSSGPDGIVIPLIAIPAIFLIMHDVLRMLTNKNLKFLFGKEISYPFILVFITTLLSIISSPEKKRVFYYLFQLLLFYLIYFTSLNIIKSKDDVKFVINILTVNLLTQSIIYFIQNAIGFTFDFVGEVVYHGEELQRHGGTVSANARGFANFITPLLLICFANLLAARNRRKDFLPYIIFGAGFSALILTFTRSAWMGFILGSIWIIIFGVRQQVIYLKRLLPFFVVAFVVIILLLPGIMLRLSADHEAAYEERTALMRIAWNIIKANPWLGVGAGAYSYVFRNYIPVELTDKWLYVVHNVYLLKWAETGIFGLLSFLALLYTGLRQAFVCSRIRDETIAPLALGWGGGFISLIWDMMWDLALGPQTQFIPWFIFGLMYAIQHLSANNVPFNQSQAAKQHLISMHDVRKRYA